MANLKRIFTGVMSGFTAISLAACSNSASSGSGAGSADTTNTSTETTMIEGRAAFRCMGEWIISGYV